MSSDRSAGTREFQRAPAMAPLMLKAALPAVPGIGSLPGIRHASGEVPDLTLRRDGVPIDPDDLARYEEVCGFGHSDTLPATYPHMAAFGLHMTLMTDTSFPFAPMGVVHLRNRIVQHRPLTADDALDIEVRAADLRPHPKGQLVDLVTTVSAAGPARETVWEEVTTLFSRGAGGGPEDIPAPLEGLEAPQGVVRWRLDGALGRRYGAVSGDRNPIHLYPATAKPFGFPRNIAHGMWTMARCLAGLQNRLPDAFSVDVEFKKPILLPSTVIFGYGGDDAGVTFGVRAQRRNATHLVGRVNAI